MPEDPKHVLAARDLVTSVTTLALRRLDAPDPTDVDLEMTELVTDAYYAAGKYEPNRLAVSDLAIQFAARMTAAVLQQLADEVAARGEVVTAAELWQSIAPKLYR